MSVALATAPAPDPEPQGYLTPQDHTDLDQAIVLITSVIDRHPMEITTHTMSIFDTAISTIRIGERYMRGGC